jgi:hypothetical protein
VTVALDLGEVREWIAGAAGPIESLELAKERAWATTIRAQVRRSAGSDVVWFKACAPVQAFEPRLTAELAHRWPDRVARVVATDERRGWLLTADAGVSIGVLGNPPETWLRVLPRYAELQRGEIGNAADHLEHGVPDLRVATLPAGFEALLATDLPIDTAARARLERFGPTFVALCRALADTAPVASIQHDDLHVNGVFVRDDEPRVLDWGDASIAHPFFSLVVTFWFLERHNGLAPGDPWFARLRDAYLEPWGGPELREAFQLAFRVGLAAHPIAWLRHRRAMSLADRAGFDRHFAELLAWVLERAGA